jgi:hypothetical protein
MRGYAPIFVFVVVSLTSCASGSRVERIDVSGKSDVELVGAQGTTIQVQSPAKSKVVVASKSASGTEVISSTTNGKLDELIVIQIASDTKVYLVDEDGDGLPDVKQTREVLKNGGERTIKIERLSWTTSEKKADD